MNSPLKQQMLYTKDIEQLTGRSIQTLRRWWNKDKFPKPSKPTDGVLVWRAEIIFQWIDQNI